MSDENETTELAPIPEHIEAEASVTKTHIGVLQQLALQPGKLEVYLKEMQGALKVIKTTAIRNSHPFSWTKYRDRDGKVICVPRDQACVEIRKWMGICIENISGPEVSYEDSTGERVTIIEMWADGHSNLTGEKVEKVYYAVKSNEDFTGRRGRIQDLKASCRTGLDNKITRILSGLRKVPEEDLQREGLNTDQCYKGHGYGSSTERSASSVADSGVKEKAAGLGNEILKRTGGDKAAAGDLLQEITSNPAKDFKGFRSIDRLTKQWQVENAWKKLKEHPTFGDQREPGSDDDIGEGDGRLQF